VTKSELKKRLYELVTTYFGGATVRWSNTKGVNPNAPLVSLNLFTVNRPYTPVRTSVDGVIVDSYPSKVTLQVDLFTKGRGAVTPGVTSANENTAEDDLIEFVNFVNSVYGDEWSLQNDISLLANEVQDLTGIVNDTAWEYRAMVEFEVGFTQHAVGHTGTMYDDGILYYGNGQPVPGDPGFTQTPSGGNTQELAELSTGWFESVDGPTQKQ